jgi:hypothetical protein
MGSDDTIATLNQQLSSSTIFLGFGHKYSIAWVTETYMEPDQRVPNHMQSSWDSLAFDSALHDSRGCMSPSIVFTTLPLEVAIERLDTSMRKAEELCPRGIITDYEGAEIRNRSALTKVVGHVRSGHGYTIHGLPHSYVQPAALPRTVEIVSVKNAHEAVDILHPWASGLSTVGTDDPNSIHIWRKMGTPRVCRLGRMQSPPIVRPHDGVDWLKAIQS